MLFLKNTSGQIKLRFVFAIFTYINELNKLLPLYTINGNVKCKSTHQKKMDFTFVLKPCNDIILVESFRETALCNIHGFILQAHLPAACVTVCEPSEVFRSLPVWFPEKRNDLPIMRESTRASSV